MAVSTSRSSGALLVGAASDRGRIRDENQDRISRFQSAHGEVFLVVDGMGGHGDGGRAAEIAVAALEQALAAAPRSVDPSEAAFRAVDHANRALLHDSEARAADQGGRKAGATLVMAMIERAHLRVIHAGDCRAYLLKDRSLRPLTRDHTLVQQMVDANLLSPDGARDHPDASVVTRALGQEELLTAEISASLAFEPGDRLLLCSDGLTGYVDDAEIKATLVATSDVQTATRRLIALALAAGGEDNVSVQLIERVAQGVDKETPAAPSPGRRRTLPSDQAATPRSPRNWRLLVGTLLVVGLIAAVWITIARQPSPTPAEPSPTQLENGHEPDLSPMPHREP